LLPKIPNNNNNSYELWKICFLFRANSSNNNNKITSFGD
jgi:hypothetical protein